MKENLIQFYFSFDNPYSYYANAKLHTMLSEYRVELDYIPLVQLWDLQLFHKEHLEGLYYLEDLKRISQGIGLPFKPLEQHIDSLIATLGYYYLSQEAPAKRYINLILASRWGNKKDIGNESVLADLVKIMGVQSDQFLDGIQNIAVRKMLEEETRKAEDLGVFDVPFFIFRGEKFFGYDRLDMLLQRLNEAQLKIIHNLSFSVVTNEEVLNWIEKENPIIIDLRLPKDYREGHIPKACLIPAKVLVRQYHRIDKDKKVLVYDQDGTTSSEAAQILISNGYQSVYNLRGGFSSWNGNLEKGLESRDQGLNPL